MASNFTDFTRELALATEGMSPREIARAHAAFAKECLAEVQAEMGKTDFTRVVDRVRGAPEEAVTPGGLILYEFHHLQRVCEFAIQTARKISPVDSGRYRESWFFLVDGVDTPLEAIRPGATVHLVNDQPYARAIHARSIPWRVPPGIVERVRQAVYREFRGLVYADIDFLGLAGGYVLKGRRKRKGRKDLAAGQEMSYPALRIRERD